MRSNYGKPLRNYLREGTYLTQIIDFGELPVFPEAATFPAIYLTMKAKPKPTSITIYTKVASLEFISLDSLVASQGLSLSTSAFEGENWTLTKDDETAIMRKMESIGIPLGSYVNGGIKRGVLTGLNEAFIIDRTTRDRLISEDSSNSKILKPIIVGDDIRSYNINFKDKYLIYIPWHFPLQDDKSIVGASKEAEEEFKKQYPSIFNHISKFKDQLSKRNTAETGIRYEWYALQRFASDYFSEFEKPKIVYPDIAKESRMAYDSDGLYLTNTAYLIPTKDIYLLCVLNSKLIFTYYKRIAAVLGDSEKGGRIRWFSQDVIRLPIRRISFTTPAPERARLGAQMQQLYADGKHAEILAQVDVCLPKDATGNFIAEQERSDVVHDLLAFLAERMLEMNKQKQTEVKGFLGWLESYLGAKVEDLTPKTKLQGYYEHDYESFLAVLKKNSKKLAVDPARREPAEKLRAEFEESMGKLLPLRERIRQTDELIDATVYRLYGLTEEEIGIVEGRESATEHPRASSLDSA